VDKTVDMAKTSASGSFHLFLGKLITTAILGIGTILLGAYIQDQELGLFTVAMIPSVTLLLFQDLGVGLAITKYCAEYIGLKNEEKLRGLVKVGLSFNVVTGILLTIISLVSANFIAPSIFGKPEAAVLILVASFAIFFTALLTASQSIFFGFERMKLATYTMIIQAIVQAVLSPLLVYIGYGAMGAVIGYTLSCVAAGTFGIILVYFAIFKKLPYSPSININKPELLKMLLSFGLPLAISTILAGVLTNVYSFTMASVVAAALIGNYRIASYFGSFLEFFTYPISTTLFPAFSKVDPQKEPEILKSVFTSSVKYTAFFLLPATMAMIVLSGSIIGTLYADKWLYAPLFLAFYGLNNLFSVFGNISVNSFLRGVGETKFLLKQNILTLIIGIPLAFLMIPAFGIIGVILGPIIAGKPGLFWGLYHMWKHYKVKVDFMSSIKLFVISAITAIITYLFLNYLHAADLIKLIVGVSVFAAIYLVATPIVGGITQTDINNLKVMFSDLGFVSKLFNIPLVLLEKIANYFHSDKNLVYVR
jgi:O-antigen/teichoic acid export membrane protein